MTDYMEIDEEFIREAHEAAGAWAKHMLTRRDWVILDTETTGLGGDDQVLQVGMLGPDGEVLLDTLVKVTCPIHPKAFEVHGIRDADLKDAPPFAEVLPKIRAIAEGKYLVIYNGDFDLRLMAQSATAAGLPPSQAFFMHYDAMIEYARWVGEWNDYRGDFRWQRLPGGTHGAIGDCQAVLALMRRMAGQE